MGQFEFYVYRNYRHSSIGQRCSLPDFTFKEREMLQYRPNRQERSFLRFFRVTEMLLCLPALCDNECQQTAQ